MDCIQTLESRRSFYTKKYIFSDGARTVECVYVDRIDKHIICLSCMYGCPIGCSFCLSGTNYYGDVDLEDLKYMINYIIKDKAIDDSKRTVFSFMGSGEPLMCIKIVCDCINFIVGISKNLSVSMAVSGAEIENINYLSDNAIIIPRLHLSLHSPFDAERRKIIPATSSLTLIINHLKDYKNKTNTPITANYILLKDFNDTKKHAEALCKFIKETGFELKINEYHYVGKGFVESPCKELFLSWLAEGGIVPEIYSTDGVDIGAACGQLKSSVMS